MKFRREWIIVFLVIGSVLMLATVGYVMPFARAGLASSGKSPPQVKSQGRQRSKSSVVYYQIASSSLVKRALAFSFSGGSFSSRAFQKRRKNIQQNINPGISLLDSDVKGPYSHFPYPRQYASDYPATVNYSSGKVPFFMVPISTSSPRQRYSPGTGSGGPVIVFIPGDFRDDDSGGLDPGEDPEDNNGGTVEPSGGGEPSPVPLPGSLVLLASGLAGLVLKRRFFRQKAGT